MAVPQTGHLTDAIVSSNISDGSPVGILVDDHCHDAGIPSRHSSSQNDTPNSDSMVSLDHSS